MSKQTLTRVIPQSSLNVSILSRLRSLSRHVKPVHHTKSPFADCILLLLTNRSSFAKSQRGGFWGGKHSRKITVRLKHSVQSFVLCWCFFGSSSQQPPFIQMVISVVYRFVTYSRCHTCILCQMHALHSTTKQPTLLMWIQTRHKSRKAGIQCQNGILKCLNKKGKLLFSKNNLTCINYPLALCHVCFLWNGWSLVCFVCVLLCTRVCAPQDHSLHALES